MRSYWKISGFLLFASLTAAHATREEFGSQKEIEQHIKQNTGEEVNIYSQEGETNQDGNLTRFCTFG